MSGYITKKELSMIIIIKHDIHEILGYGNIVYGNILIEGACIL